MMKNWKELKRHPLSAEYPDLNGIAWERFLDRIETSGLSGRKITIHDGMVLDGWQLQRACVELNKKPKYDKVPMGWTAEAFVEAANDNRRHETQEQVIRRVEERRARVIEKRQQGMSLRAIAKEENVSEATVRNDVEAVSGAQGCAPENAESANFEASLPKTVTGEDGKTYDATRPAILCPCCERARHVGQPANRSCPECKKLRAKMELEDDIEEANCNPEVIDDAEQTIDAIIKAKNHEIESFCRQLMAFVDKGLPHDEWLDDLGRREGAIQKFKDGCATLRSAKCRCACPKCQGEGCTKCRKTGRVPDYTYKQLT
jgi:hypothetical protein